MTRPSTEADGDPAGPTEDPRPVVGRAVSNRFIWLFFAGLALVALLLFTALEARRAALTRSNTAPSGTTLGDRIAAPPVLAIPGVTGPAEYDYGVALPIQPGPRVPVVGPQSYPAPPGPSPRGRSFGGIPGPPIVAAPTYYGLPPAPSYTPSAEPDVASPPAAVDAPTDDHEPSGGLSGTRAAATRLRNPAMTVPQGTVIQAVLETAFDSNHPGFARAIVSRDVRGFDGSTVLIPRGSRLFGEYKSDLVAGQNRAFVTWQKLTRPDGGQIAIDSPAADPLGRGGIRGKVNSHFFSRFGPALLQSTLDFAVGAATRSASGGDSVIIGLPGSTQQITRGSEEAVRPTLTVKQGSRVSVFVARDLDFSSID